MGEVGQAEMERRWLVLEELRREVDRIQSPFRERRRQREALLVEKEIAQLGPMNERPRQEEKERLVDQIEARVRAASEDSGERAQEDALIALAVRAAQDRAYHG